MNVRLAAALCGVSTLLAFSPVAHAQSGIASIYSGGRTANGEHVVWTYYNGTTRTFALGEQVAAEITGA